MKLALGLLLVWSFALRVWMGSVELTGARFWDERFGLENIEKMLRTGEVKPANGFHPSLSYLPQAALLGASEGLYRLTGWQKLQVLEEDRGIRPTGYFLCRFSQAVFGALTLWLTFVVGRRLFSAPVGLLAVLLLAVVPWHMRQSVIYKPDVLLLLTSLWAFLASLDAAERPSRRRYLVAGSLIGVALASKFNAGPIAIPLMVAAWFGRPGRPRQESPSRAQRLRWLVLAGVVSVLVFVLFNPFAVLDPNLYVSDFQRTLKDYAKKGDRFESSHGYVFVHGMESLVGEGFHGPVVGSLALGATLALTVWLGVAAWRRRRSDGTDQEVDDDEARRRLFQLMALSFVYGYTVIYCLSTTNPSAHNWLSLTPFLALFAAWALAAVWRLVTARWPVPVRRWVGAAALAALVLWLVIPANRFAYDRVVPTTQHLAQLDLRGPLEPLTLRMIYHEEIGQDRFVVKDLRRKAAMFGAEDLSEVGDERLAAADAVVFPRRRLEGAGGDFYAGRLARVPPEQVRRYDAELFKARGPDLVALVHPWRKVGKVASVPLSAPPARQNRSTRRLHGRLPADLSPGTFASLEIFLPPRDPGDLIEELTVGGRGLSFAWAGRRGGYRFLTDRFEVAGGNPEDHRVLVRLRRPLAADERVVLRLHRWRPPA